MKICAIYTVWDDWDLLQHSLKNIRPLVNGVIVVFSLRSNTNEERTGPDGTGETLEAGTPVFFIRMEPDLKEPQVKNERAKRNFGLKRAKEDGYTHFLMLDADEFYEPTEFLKEKERFKNPDLLGLVCRVKTYFKLPTLTIGYDVTLVPFIHKITPDLRFEWNTKYPYAFAGPKREIRIDPTRQMNISSGVEWSEITMHHYSWIRPDIRKKIRNSTARQNIEKSTIVRDYVDAKPGYYCEFYKSTIESCENLFNIPDIIDYELLRSQDQQPS